MDKMLSFRDLVSGFRKLDLDPKKPLMVHGSLSSFGEEVRGGAETLLGALLATSDALICPTFTYKTLVIPEDGPENNGMVYGTGKDHNLMAEFYRATMPADRLMGILAETLRLHPNAERSIHPVLSFSAINLDDALEAQTLQDHLAPIRVIAEKQAWIILIGVDHTVNTSIHYAERLAGRKQFIRWALTSQGVVECPGYSGCSNGFQEAEDWLTDITRSVKIGESLIEALPMQPMLEIITQKIKEDPLALLCGNPNCERCSAIFMEVTKSAETPSS
jgi:aminoglycoside 3-N-acetyltransferase